MTVLRPDQPLSSRVCQDDVDDKTGVPVEVVGKQQTAVSAGQPWTGETSRAVGDVTGELCVSRQEVAGFWNVHFIELAKMLCYSFL